MAWAHIHFVWFFLMTILPLFALVGLGCAYQPRSAASAGVESGDNGLRDLPLVVCRPDGPPQDCLAVLITGDGGWARLSRVVAADLNQAGVGVIGLNARKYYWTPRTPAGAARDLERIIDHYGSGLGHDGGETRDVILIGYSRGAGVLPFMFNRLSPAMRERVRVVALLGLTPGISFHLRLREYLGRYFEVDEMPVLPELKRIRENKILCIYGENEPDSICRELRQPNIHVVGLPGGHHFGGRYDIIASLILKEADLPLRPGNAAFRRAGDRS